MKLASAAIMIRPRCLPDSIIARKVSAPEFLHSLGQLRTPATYPHHVRSWGKSRLRFRVAGCLFVAKSGHSRRATATRCGAFGGRKTRSRRPPPCTARGPSLVWWCLWTRPAPDGAKGAPARIGLPHPSNEAPRLRRDRWATTATPTTQPTPVVTEAFVLPRLGLSEAEQRTRPCASRSTRLQS